MILNKYILEIVFIHVWYETNIFLEVCLFTNGIVNKQRSLLLFVGTQQPNYIRVNSVKVYNVLVNGTFKNSQRITYHDENITQRSSCI